MIQSEDSCPYGLDNECPKIRSIRSMIEKNGEKLDGLEREVTTLATTVKNAGYVITIIVAIVVALIGLVKL